MQIRANLKAIFDENLLPNDNRWRGVHTSLETTKSDGFLAAFSKIKYKYNQICINS